MKLYGAGYADDGSPYQRLMRSLTGEMAKEGKVPAGRQTQPLTSAAIENIFGSKEDFINSYKNFEDNYFRMLQDPANLKKFARVRDIDLERKSGIINLSLLNFENQQQLRAQFMDTVLRKGDLFSKTGIPGLEYPSGNLYSSALLKYDISAQALEGADAHPAAVLLNRMFFNTDPSKIGFDAFNFGQSNMMSVNSLERITAMQDFKSTGKRVMTFDVETTGVTYDSQVRQFAYEIQEADETISKKFAQNFINEKMDIASVSRSGVSMRMSEFVAQTEGGDARLMGQGGQNFVDAAKSLYTEMLNVDHVSGHNLLFDINKMSDTLQSLDAFHMDKEAQELQTRLFTKIADQKDYLIDTQETMRSYFTRKADELIGLSGDRAERIVSQMLGPEMLAQIGIGGSTTPVSVENIALNSNLLKLIEEGDVSRAEEITKKLAAGSHIADTDVAIQASMESFRSKETLDFRFDLDGKPIGGPLSDFEKFARNRILKSQAITPTTNLASAAHASDATRSYLLDATNKTGMQQVTLSATTADLGLTGDGEGFLKFNRSKDLYEFTRYGSMDSISVDATRAEAYISSTLREAFAEGEGVESNLRVGSSTLRVTRNFADEKILNLGRNFLQETKVQRITSARTAMGAAGISLDAMPLAPTDELIQSLGLTSRQFAEPQTVRSMFSRIGNALRGAERFNTLLPATALSDDVMQQYQVNAARAGLPFTSIDTADRVTSVGLAQITAHLGEAAGMNLSHARNAKLTTEMGLSYAKMQRSSRIGSISAQGDLVPASRVIAPFERIFDYSDVTSEVGGVKSITSQSLKVKAFSSENIAASMMDLSSPSTIADEIISSDLNRLTLSFVPERKLAGGKTVSARVNIVWGANKALSEDQSKLLAEDLLRSAETIEDTLRSLDNADGALTSSINEMTNLKNNFGALADDSKKRITAQLADHIRDRGIVVGDLGDDTVDTVTRLLAKQGVDIVDNDVRLQNLNMRLAHYDSQSGTATISAMSDTLVDEQMGRTSAKAQEETVDALNRTLKVESILDDSANKRAATRVFMESQNATRTEQAIAAGSERVRNAIPTPMTDFFLKNKKPIGFAGIGLAAAGIGYYLHKKNRESDLYNETMEAQPVEANQGRAVSAPTPLASPRSTRRDPLVTAGVVGNLDRNKIGHTNMGSNKYSHLYGG